MKVIEKVDFSGMKPFDRGFKTASLMIEHGDSARVLGHLKLLAEYIAKDYKKPAREVTRIDRDENDRIVSAHKEKILPITGSIEELTGFSCALVAAYYELMAILKTAARTDSEQTSPIDGNTHG